MLIEWELLSLNLSAHPLDFLPFDNGITRMKDLHSIATGKSAKIIGSVIGYQTPPTRNGNRVVYIIMEDGTGESTFHHCRKPVPSLYTIEPLNY